MIRSPSTRSLFRTFGMAGALALAPSLAFAHPGLDHADGLVHGFLHPLTGFDHVLAMVAVGLLAWQMGGRAVWMLPAAFMALMAAGGVLGMAGWNLPFVEMGIALSVVLLGAAVAGGLKAPLALASGAVGLFALFHGHAHGAEMPETAGGLAYGAGFVLATGLLHLTGLGLGFGIGALGQRSGDVWVRRAGAAVCVAGMGLVLGAI